MSSDFFTKLGQEVAAELGNPSGKYPIIQQNRQELANIMGVTLNNHITRPPTTAKDSAMSPFMRRTLAHDQAEMPPRGSTSPTQFDQDPNDPSGAPISGQDCLQFVQMCMQRLAGSDREDFLMGLADLLSTEEPTQDSTLMIRHGNGNGNGVRNNNQGATDRSRSGNRSARDNQMRGTRPAAMDTAFAVRALNTTNFLKRWPQAGKVSLNGFGR